MVRRIGSGVVALALLTACSSNPKVNGPADASATISKSSTSSSGQGTKSTAATLGIPPGHLPPPGQCRIWVPGDPPGHQPKAGACSNLERQVPSGAWLVYRPSEDKKHVKVWVYGQDRPDVVVVRLYDIASGLLVSEELQ